MQVMDWLDTHSGSVQAIATLVLVAITGYYAWVTRALARETRTILLSSARATLQSRMDPVSEIMIDNPGLFQSLDDAEPSDTDYDNRFHFANMFLSILEEAHTQFAVERSMPEDDWSAWAATAEILLHRAYFAPYWRRVHQTYEPSFRRFVDRRLSLSEQP
jgi:hypothetical protein